MSKARKVKKLTQREISNRLAVLHRIPVIRNYVKNKINYSLHISTYEPRPPEDTADVIKYYLFIMGKQKLWNHFNNYLTRIGLKCDGRVSKYWEIDRWGLQKYNRTPPKRTED